MAFIEEHGLVRYTPHLGLRKMHVGKPCEGCARPGTGIGLDHCHAHGWVRGVLCGGCNYRMKAIDARYPDPYHPPVLLRYWENCPDCAAGGPWVAGDPPPERRHAGRRYSLYLSDELNAAVKASGLPLAELVRRGLEAGERPGKPFDEATLRRVIDEELIPRLRAARAAGRI